MSNTNDHDLLVSIWALDVTRRTETGRLVIVSSFLRGTSYPEIIEMTHGTYMISINSSTEACPGKSFLLPSYAFGEVSVKCSRPAPGTNHKKRYSCKALF